MFPIANSDSDLHNKSFMWLSNNIIGMYSFIIYSADEMLSIGITTIRWDENGIFVDIFHSLDHEDTDV